MDFGLTAKLRETWPKNGKNGPKPICWLFSAIFPVSGAFFPYCRREAKIGHFFPILGRRPKPISPKQTCSQVLRDWGKSMPGTSYHHFLLSLRGHASLTGISRHQHLDGWFRNFPQTPPSVCLNPRHGRGREKVGPRPARDFEASWQLKRLAPQRRTSDRPLTASSRIQICGKRPAKVRRHGCVAVVACSSTPRQTLKGPLQHGFVSDTFSNSFTAPLPLSRQRPPQTHRMGQGKLSSQTQRFEQRDAGIFR